MWYRSSLRLPTEAQVLVHDWAVPLYDWNSRYAFVRGGRWSGKSRELAQLVEYRMATIPGYSVLVCREYNNTLEESGLRVLQKVIEAGPRKPYYRIVRGLVTNTYTGARCTFRGVKNNPQSIQSLEGIHLAWVEEAHSVNDYSLEILRPTIREPGSQIIFAWNPTREDDAVERLWRTVEDEHPTINAHWTMLHPALQTEELHEERRLTSPDVYEHIWDGAYRPIGLVSPFTRQSIDGALSREHLLTDSQEKVCGVDVAWTENGDYTACVKLDLVGNELDSLAFREPDAHRRTARIAEFANDCYYVLVDATEAAGRQTDIDLGGKSRPFVFSSKTKDDLVQYAARRLSDGTVTVRSQALVQELRRYSRDERGRYAADTGHDDLVCAWMLALECLRQVSDRQPLEVAVL